MPALGKSGGTVESPLKPTLVLPHGTRQSGHRHTLPVSIARRVGPRLLVTALLERLGPRTV
eukprot:3030050-Pleurochrysis_carterae.AAC.1